MLRRIRDVNDPREVSKPAKMAVQYLPISRIALARIPECKPDTFSGSIDPSRMRDPAVLD